MAELVCAHCGPISRPILEWRPYTTRSGEEHKHLGAFCDCCGRWVKWLRQQKPMLPAPRRGP
jgi:hypothetical protein